jgi:membrane protease YdiL (CAAX protease family)
LSSLEKSKFLGMAVLNATCEELISWRFVRSLFELIFRAGSMQNRNDSFNSHLSNVFQGAVFGAWHFYGVPSGWTGVLLTTLYGIIMGYLADFYPSLGLWLPIVLHSIADYYIFAVLVRTTRCYSP